MSEGSELRQSVAIASERIQEIIDTAERVAEGIRRDAEVAAEAYLADRRREADELAAAQARRLEDVLETLRAQLGKLENESAAMIDAVKAAIDGPERG